MFFFSERVRDGFYFLLCSFGFSKFSMMSRCYFLNLHLYHSLLSFKKGPCRRVVRKRNKQLFQRKFRGRHWFFAGGGGHQYTQLDFPNVIEIGV